MLCVRYFVGNGFFIFVKTNVGEFYKKNKHKYNERTGIPTDQVRT